MFSPRVDQNQAADIAAFLGSSSSSRLSDQVQPQSLAARSIVRTAGNLDQAAATVLRSIPFHGVTQIYAALIAGLLSGRPPDLAHVTQLARLVPDLRDEGASPWRTDDAVPVHGSVRRGNKNASARARVGVDCQNATLIEALDQYPDAADFYIQKPQCWNGNNLIWLCEDGVFTSDLSKAVVVPRAHTVIRIGKLGQSGAVVWPKPYIDAHSRRLVERDDVNIKDALRGTGIKLAKPKKPKMMMFNCDGCGRFISDAQRYREDRRNCGTSNMP